LSFQLRLPNDRSFVASLAAYCRHVGRREGSNQKGEENPERHVDPSLPRSISHLFRLFGRLSCRVLSSVKRFGHTLFSGRLTQTCPARDDLTHVCLIGRGMQSVEVGGRRLEALVEAAAPIMLRHLAECAHLSAGGEVHVAPGPSATARACQPDCPAAKSSIASTSGGS
jgi:hypothetical protein